MSRPPLPPFNAETAAQKVRMAEDAWNSRESERVSLRYAPDGRWRGRAECVEGRSANVALATRNWAKELECRRIKEVWTRQENRIAVPFAYVWRDDSGSWFRSHGNEEPQFDPEGPARLRIASVDDLPIRAQGRRFHRPQWRRHDDHPGLSALGL